MEDTLSNWALERSDRINQCILLPAYACSMASQQSSGVVKRHCPGTPGSGRGCGALLRADLHPLCVNHRTCFSEVPCTQVCAHWTGQDWEALPTRRKKGKAEAARRKKKLAERNMASHTSGVDTDATPASPTPCGHGSSGTPAKITS